MGSQVCPIQLGHLNLYFDQRFFSIHAKLPDIGKFRPTVRIGNKDRVSSINSLQKSHQGADWE